MKPATSDLIALLQGADHFLMADCFTFTLLSGQQLFYTTADVPVTVGSQVFAADAVRVSGLKYKIATGVDVDEQDITLQAAPTDTVNGVPFLVALRDGVFDGATIQRDRAFLSAWTQPAIGSVTLFHGRISTIDQIGRTTAQMKVKSDLVLLDIDMPRNLYQPSCLHTLYDANCGVSRAAYSTTGACAVGSTVSTLIWAGVLAESTGYYDQGTLLFTAGPNAGVSVTVKSSATTGGGQLVLAYPLNAAPGVGDSFTISAGCDHSMGPGGCAKFNNLPRFRGFPYVPPPEIAY
jgi:uncharacterized phage protein (TIGR02218 family)